MLLGLASDDALNIGVEVANRVSSVIGGWSGCRLGVKLLVCGGRSPAARTEESTLNPPLRGLAPRGGPSLGNSLKV
jgi:hypothetical protein